MHLTPEALEASYIFLRSLRRGWRRKLPDADEVRFCVTGSTIETGYCREVTVPGQPRRWEIGVSAKKISHLTPLLKVTAHEMVHLENDLDGVKAHHGAVFHRRAGHVCRLMGWDPKEF